MVSCSPESILNFPCTIEAIWYNLAHLVKLFQLLENYDNVVFVNDESDLSDWKAPENGIFRLMSINMTVQYP